MCVCDTRAARAHTPVEVGRPEADRPRCARRGIDQKAPPAPRPPDIRSRRRRQRCRVTSRAREKERPKRARDRTPSPHRRRRRRRGDDGRAFGEGVPASLPACPPPVYLRWSAKGALPPPGEVVQALRFRRLDGLERQSCGWAVGV